VNKITGNKKIDNLIDDEIAKAMMPLSSLFYFDNIYEQVCGMEGLRAVIQELVKNVSQEILFEYYKGDDSGQ